MDRSRVALATLTWARSAEEEALLRRSLLRLAELGLPLALADRGSSPAFTAFLQQLPQTRIAVETAGLVPQVQASIAIAATFARPFVLYTEPDKAFFFERQLLNFLERAPDEPDVGVVLAARSDESFQSFPPTQRYTEEVINNLCGMVFAVCGDYSYGPFLLNRTLLAHLPTVAPDVGWGWRHSTFRAAHRAGLRIVHLAGEYPCPPEQQVEDNGEVVHRMRQLSQNIAGLIG